MFQTIFKNLHKSKWVNFSNFSRGKQTEIEPEHSLLQTSVHYQKPKPHTTQANEINVCAECNTDKRENSSHVNFPDKTKIRPNLFQTVLIVLQCLII